MRISLRYKAALLIALTEFALLGLLVLTNLTRRAQTGAAAPACPFHPPSWSRPRRPSRCCLGPGADPQSPDRRGAQAPGELRGGHGSSRAPAGRGRGRGRAGKRRGGRAPDLGGRYAVRPGHAAGGARRNRGHARQDHALEPDHRRLRNGAGGVYLAHPRLVPHAQLWRC